MQNYLEVRRHCQEFRRAALEEANKLSGAAQDDILSKQLQIVKLELEAALKLQRCVVLITVGRVRISITSLSSAGTARAQIVTRHLQIWYWSSIRVSCRPMLTRNTKAVSEKKNTCWKIMLIAS